MSDKAKTRISVTMTKPYLDALNRLVDEGIYLTKGEIILEALRHHLKSYGLEPFAAKPKDKEEK